ncbi:MAG: hypothetical protein ACI8ZN_002376 [Bacteroidia bacterium]|jgi:hypothetical protein
MKNCLLLGRKASIVDDLTKNIDAPNVNFMSGTDLEEVKKVFNQHHIHAVIMGAGIDLNNRLEIVKYIFETSTSTTVHMKDWDSGPTGMFPFVKAALLTL